MSNDKWQKFKEAAELEQDSCAEQETNQSDGQVSQQTDDAEKTSQKAQPGLEHLSYEALEEQLTLTEQQKHEYWEKLTRMSAELDNVRRRAEKDIASAHRYGAEKLIAGMLPVLDSLDQALLLVDQEKHTAMYDGLHLTQKLFLDTLTKHGVVALDPQGLSFDPKEHEAMSMLESETHAPNTVITVFQKGYRLHDRVIRAAKVIVAKAKG